jgi:glycosyltransferase involved in cell wall biosynthesis
VDLKARLGQAFPQVHLRFLCNELKDVSRFQSQGLATIHCNHNAFVDESIFLPDARADREFDAVYDARLLWWKRHGLAIRVASLGLLYYLIPGVEDPNYIGQVQRDFAHAHFFNHEGGAYQLLGPAAIAKQLNRCRVGLCLSASEGAMYASMQYLLCGLKVVSTPSFGGRAEFFDERYCQIVDPDPAAIQKAVSELAARPVDPALIRRETLARMQPHRQRLLPNKTFQADRGFGGAALRQRLQRRPRRRRTAPRRIGQKIE